MDSAWIPPVDNTTTGRECHGPGRQVRPRCASSSRCTCAVPGRNSRKVEACRSRRRARPTSCSGCSRTCLSPAFPQCCKPYRLLQYLSPQVGCPIRRGIVDREQYANNQMAAMVLRVFSTSRGQVSRLAAHASAGPGCRRRRSRRARFVRRRVGAGIPLPETFADSVTTKMFGAAHARSQARWA